MSRHELELTNKQTSCSAESRSVFPPLFISNLPNACSDFNVHAGPVDTAFILEHLSYKSPYSEQLLVEDLSLTISQGNHLLVVGNTGTGKTSLLRVLNRLWEAHSGEAPAASLRNRSFRLRRRHKVVRFFFFSQVLSR